MRRFFVLGGCLLAVGLTVLLIMMSSSDGLAVSLPQAVASGPEQAASTLAEVPSVSSAASDIAVSASALPEEKAQPVSVASAAAKPVNVKIGVYYFPGWRDRTPAAPSDYPWVAIKKFPEREPLQGWYDEGEADVMSAHLEAMARNGISYVAFDWYWGSDNRAYLGHALDTYLRLKNKQGVQFSLLWSNHDDAPVSVSNFDRMVDYWIRRYFDSPSYLKIDGKPLVTVFSSAQLEDHATKMGVTVAQLLARANQRVREEGLPGIYFVAGTTSDEPGFKKFSLRDSGYDAVSAYNLHWLPGASHASHSFVELDNAYRAHWSRYRSIGQLPVIVPLSTGWDKRPWGGSDDPVHDQSVGTPDEFEVHMRAGLAEIQKGGPPYLGVICCWNEFGEGSYLEPTKKLGDAVLRKVGKVLKEAKGS